MTNIKANKGRNSMDGDNGTTVRSLNHERKVRACSIAYECFALFLQEMLLQFISDSLL